MFEGEKPRGRVVGFGEQFLAPGVQSIALPIVGYALILFFLVQGPFLFPEQWAVWQPITIIFALFLIPVLILTLLNVHPFNIPAWKVLAFFGIALGASLLLFKVLFSGFGNYARFPTGDLFSTSAYQIFVVTYCEESFFRGFLLTLGKNRVGMGILGSSIAFSIFHLAAYSVAGGGLNLFAFVVAFVMGIVFGLVYFATRDYAGYGVPWGMHAGFNLALLFG